jgi:hypothetical protein
MHILEFTLLAQLARRLGAHARLKVQASGVGGGEARGGKGLGEWG